MRIANAGIGQCVPGVSTDEFGDTIAACGPDASLMTGDSMVVGSNLPLSAVTTPAQNPYQITNASIAAGGGAPAPAQSNTGTYVLIGLAGVFLFTMMAVKR